MELNNDIECVAYVEGNRNRTWLAVLIFLLSFCAVVLCTVLKFTLVDAIVGKNRLFTYISLVLGYLFLYSSLVVYYFFSRGGLISNVKYLGAQISAITLVYIICLFSSLINVFVMPVFLTAYFVAPLAKRSDSFITNIATNILLAFTLIFEQFLTGGADTGNVIVMFVIGVIIGTLISYSISYDTKRLNFILKGVFVGVTAIVIMLCLCIRDLLDFSHFWPQLLYMGIAVIVQLVLGILAQPLFENIFNLVTNARLIDLTDHNAPLIKRLIEEAPGTFNHSLTVANFAEVCATSIGENPYLARACAYYHDIGKLVNPQYFSENQSDYNPHDELLPEVSAEIIRNHTHQGLELCREYHIPEEVSNITVQHHGTMPIMVFYQKAKELTDNIVDIKDYSHNGITPLTKIAAIIMLCDSSEAAIKAMDKPDGEKVDKLLRRLISERIEKGQFDNCDITLRDLDTIRETIIAAYGGLYHKRVKYPEGTK